MATVPQNASIQTQPPQASNAVVMVGSGPTAQRPGNPPIGFLYYDTVFEAEYMWSGTQWLPVSPASAAAPVGFGTTAQRPVAPVVSNGYVYYDTTLKAEIVCIDANTVPPAWQVVSPVGVIQEYFFTPGSYPQVVSSTVDSSGWVAFDLTSLIPSFITSPKAAVFNMLASWGPSSFSSPPNTWTWQLRLSNAAVSVTSTLVPLIDATGYNNNSVGWGNGSLMATIPFNGTSKTMYYCTTGKNNSGPGVPPASTASASLVAILY